VTYWWAWLGFGPARITCGSIRSVMLTTRQRNEIFGLIAARGLDPASCQLRDRTLGSGMSQADLLHPPTKSIFTVWHPERLDLYSANVVVGDAEQVGCTSVGWPELMRRLARWADEVRYEVDTADLWAELKRVPQLLAASQTPDASNAPFTPNEQSEVSRRLDEIKTLVRERFELTGEQLAVIDQRLDEAEEASKRLGRKDWVMMFYGAVMSTFMTDAVPTNVIQTVLITVLHGIAHIFGFGGPPPIITT
jgi:hypothetical protein